MSTLQDCYTLSEQNVVQQALFDTKSMDLVKEIAHTQNPSKFKKKN